jgi:hypothetical protein
MNFKSLVLCSYGGDRICPGRHPGWYEAPVRLDQTLARLPPMRGKPSIERHRAVTVDGSGGNPGGSRATELWS